MALCLNPDMDYVRVRDKTRGDQQFVLMEARLGDNFKSPDDYEIIERRKGATLKDTHYRPLFNYFVETMRERNAYCVLADTYVTAESGTGIVHQAPYFGEDDHRVCLAAGVITKVFVSKIKVYPILINWASLCLLVVTIVINLLLMMSI